MEYVPPVGSSNPDAPYVDFNPVTLEPGSIPPAAAIAHPMREVVHVIKTVLGEEAANGDDLTQLYQSIAAMIAAAAPNLGTAAYKDWGNGIGQLPEVEAATGKLNPAIIPSTASDALYKQILLNSLLDGEVSGTALRLMDGWADPYIDAGGIDAGLSSGYAVTGGSLTAQPAGYGSNLFIGGAASASISTPYPPSAAVDNNLGTAWVGTGTSGTWWQYTLPVAAALARIEIVHSQIKIGNFGIAAFTLKCSDTGAFTGEEIVALSQAGISSWGENEVRTFDVVGAPSVRYWRIYLTGVNGGLNPGMVEIKGYAYTTPGDMVAVSTERSCYTVPSAGHWMAIVEPDGTYNTDLTVDLRRAEAGAWEAVPVAKIGETREGYDVVYGRLDFAGTAGSAMRSRISALNGSQPVIHASIMDGSI